MSLDSHLVDAIVVGAGLSGLQAARDIQLADKSCVVLEARSRVGGKTWLVPAGKSGIVELGAAWYNDINQPRVTALVNELGLETIKQNTTGNCVMQGHGLFPYGEAPNLPALDRESFISVRDEVERLCHTIDAVRPDGTGALKQFECMSFDDLVVSIGATGPVQRIASIWTRAMLGKEASDCSALYCLMYFKAGHGFLTMRSDGKGGGQAIRIRKGTQSLSIGLAASLKPGSLLLDHAVWKIEQRGSSCYAVTTSAGQTFHSRTVVVSLPSPLYKTIDFSPPLSKDKTALVNSTSLGFYGKVHLVYSTPWWRERGLCGLTQAVDGPVAITRDTSSDADNLYDLTCFTVGKPAADWHQLPDTQRRVEILKAINEIYGMKCPDPIQYVEHEWGSEQFTRGCPCPSVPNSALEAWDRDQWKAEGNVFFVGTETAHVWRGYMEGALASGARGARDVLRALDILPDPRAKL